MIAKIEKTNLIHSYMLTITAGHLVVRQTGIGGCIPDGNTPQRPGVIFWVQGRTSSSSTSQGPEKLCFCPSARWSFWALLSCPNPFWEPI
ncbi:hypothetical protein CEXT_308221 [Caerostris extrusa]|uniref:Uncharacterized protein n=1 Tax=Caerostris extrusa TaxID=172846 RepID=A0AAV4P972_CAEEX|nr:hypothetical protein CEXT_308221 [Caerostris extrusa]